MGEVATQDSRGWGAAVSRAPGPADPDQPVVPDAARAVLSRMRAAARAAPGPDLARTGRTPYRPTRRRSQAGGYSGARPDDRDPMLIGGAWGSLVAEQGWTSALDVARLHGLWPDIVGPANAEHAQPESFDPESGVLLIRTSSTSWAEQLRLMMPVLRGAIDARVRPGVVREIRISGPTPPRTRGRLRVKGRGPRDTYG
jgi:predicted nucleic acid-binding Zn ribbon protein